MSTAQHANDRTTTWQRPELRRVTAKATAFGPGPNVDGEGTGSQDLL